jgi:hypothetical protein
MEARRLVSSLVLSRVSSFDACMDLVWYGSEYNKLFDDCRLLRGNDIAKFMASKRTLLRLIPS